MRTLTLLLALSTLSPSFAGAAWGPSTPSVIPAEDDLTLAREAVARGEALVAEARTAGADMDLKRDAYARAEEAFKEALAHFDAHQATHPDQDLSETTAAVRRLLYECRKSRPLSLGR